MKKNKSFDKLIDIKTDLHAAFISLFGLLFKEYPSAFKATGYIQVNFIECYLNQLKALEYHYRDSGLNGRIKKNYPPELKAALKLLEKYAENADADNPYSDLILKEKFDGTGTVAQKNKTRRPIFYQTLCDGDIIKIGDEYLGTDNKWRKVLGEIGNKHNEVSNGSIRRKINV